MGDFFANYWIEFALGLIAACIIFVIKQYYSFKLKIDDKNKEDFREEILETINKDLKEQSIHSDDMDHKMQETIQDLSNSVKQLNSELMIIQQRMIADNVDALKNGVLSMQGKIFKGDCRRLLEPNHIITEEEYEDIVADHNSYNGLGGNHIGDSLFKTVMNKWNAQIELSIKEVDE